MDLLNDLVDSSFKYILLGMNLLTIVAVWLLKRKNIPQKQHHILFVFAHPDDQAMFFGPTLTTLTSQYFIHFLCLSHGNTHRAQQLAQSAKYFQIHRHECVHDQQMIDGMQSHWNQDTIRQYTLRYINQHNIKAVFTFDQFGVSNHLNHRTIYHALSGLQVKEKKGEEKKQGEGQGGKSIKIYYLETTNILRKYTGILELLVAPFKEFSFVRINYFHGLQAMALHKSQFVWFRKLFVLFSRYTYLNTYQMKRIKID